MNTNGKMKKEKFIELNQELDKIQEIQEIKMEIQSQNNNSTNEIFLYIFFKFYNKNDFYCFIYFRNF